ncbi:hypothetical protein STRDD11_00738 [Streptococcus sp. DD11]|nr:hypothetical protein STRDD11_00738 [Streptococcus sp. DD11]
MNLRPSYLQFIEGAGGKLMICKKTVSRSFVCRPEAEKVRQTVSFRTPSFFTRLAGPYRQMILR